MAAGQECQVIGCQQHTQRGGAGFGRGEKPGDPQDVQSGWPSGVAVAAHRGRASETGRAAARQMARPESGRDRLMPAILR